MTDWIKKLTTLEDTIDQKVSENIKNYDILDQLPVIVESCTSIQLPKMLHLVLSCPQLAELPVDPDLNHRTIYDIIKTNMTRLMIAHGEQYYRETYANNSDGTD